MPWSKAFKNHPIVLVMDKQQIIKNPKERTSKQNYKDERDYKGRRKNDLAKLQNFQKKNKSHLKETTLGGTRREKRHC